MKGREREREKRERRERRGWSDMAEQVANHGGNAGDTIDVLITTSTRTTYFNVGLIVLSLAMFILAAYLVQVLYSGGVVRVKRAVTLLIGPANSGKTTLFRKVRRRRESLKNERNIPLFFLGKGN